MVQCTRGLSLDRDREDVAFDEKLTVQDEYDMAKKPINTAIALTNGYMNYLEKCEDRVSCVKTRVRK
jgi:hypothetical protein